MSKMHKPVCVCVCMCVSINVWCNYDKRDELCVFMIIGFGQVEALVSYFWESGGENHRLFYLHLDSTSQPLSFSFSLSLSLCLS